MDSNNNKLCLGHGSSVVKYLAYYELYKRKSVNWLSFILSLVFLIYATNQEQMVVIMLVSLLVLAGILYLSKMNILITLPHIAIVIASLVFILTCKECGKKRPRNETMVT